MGRWRGRRSHQQGRSPQSISLGGVGGGGGDGHIGELRDTDWPRTYGALSLGNIPSSTTVPWWRGTVWAGGSYLRNKFSEVLYLYTWVCVCVCAGLRTKFVQVHKDTYLHLLVVTWIAMGYILWIAKTLKRAKIFYPLPKWKLFDIFHWICLCRR